MKLKIGSRKSKLALWQTHRVADQLQAAHPDLQIEVVSMLTTGDRRSDEPLPSIGAKGLFTAELEAGLADGSLDLAVHSLKDLPSRLPDGLCVAGCPMRANPTDSFISTRWDDFQDLPRGARVATGSQRRRSQLLHRRPDLELTNLRGNIHTRLKKLETQGHDGIIMATAALYRLEIAEQITTELPASIHVPAVGQGAIGLEIREDRRDVRDLLAPIVDDDADRAVRAERIFMAQLEGGCSVALGAYCHRDESDQWVFHGWASSADGQQVLRETTRGCVPDELADDMARDFLARGAQELLTS